MRAMKPSISVYWPIPSLPSIPQVRFQSSEIAERGFCRECGGNLFYRRRNPADGRVSIMAGTLDAPTGLYLTGHIFFDSKSDYYEVADGTPRHARDYDSPEV